MATGLNGNLARVVRFGVYEVDPYSGELRRNGIKVKLQEQPFQILTMLLERPGEVISREELQGRLWPADTFVDFDHSLNAAIKRLRDALRDSADNPRFVETLARRGYRFVAPVAGVLSTNEMVAAASAPRPNYIGRWIGATLVLVGACISVGWHLGHRTVQPIAAKEIRLTPNSPDVPVYRASISPDGRLLAYTDPRGLFLREISREDSHQVRLPNGFRAHSVSWFPDGSHVLVGGVAGDREESSVWNVSILGGAARKLSDDTEAGSVSPDGTKIAFLRCTDKLNRSELWSMNADGSGARKLLDFSGYTFSVVWSPTGRRLAYMKVAYWPGHPEEVQIESYDVASGTTSTIFSDYRLHGGIAWARDGRLLFSREEPANSESNVWAMPVDELTAEPRGEPVRITSGPDWKPGAEVSADGKRLLFLRTNIAPTVYVIEIDPKTKAPKSLEHLTLDESQSRPYEWTPDSKSVLFLSNRDGDFHIFRQQPGGAAPELLIDGSDSPNILRLSPDATEIFYSSEVKWPTPGPSGATPRENDVRENSGNVKGPPPHAAAAEGAKVRIFRAPIAGGIGKLLLDDTGINNFQCARGPSRECLYSKFAKDALVFVEFDPATGATKELFRTGDTGWQDYNWTLSPDGRTLALCKERRVSNDLEIRLFALPSGSERALRVNEWAGILAFDWAADGKSFWASAMLRGETRALVNIDLRGNLNTVLKDSKMYIGWAIPSRDGKRLAMWQSSGGSNVWMLEGF